MVVLDEDPSSAREVAREHATRYLVLPNYTNNLRKLGFDDDDFSGPGSDRLIDAIVAWGDADAIVGRVRAHHDAGADHVCVQVLAADPASFPRDEWRALAPALLAAP
jgi:probable F420-dependent oxidoreductase